MDVGDQHEVGPLDRGGIERRAAPQVGQAGGQRRVGEDPQPAQLDEHRGVAHPREPQRRFGRHVGERTARRRPREIMSISLRYGDDPCWAG